MKQAKKIQARPEAEQSVDGAQPAENDLHRETLTAAEFALLNTLSNTAGVAERANTALAETLMDEATLEQIRRYEELLGAADIDVSSALTLLPRAIALNALKLRLEGALGIVRRNLADTIDPIATAASQVHRFVDGTPKHSKVRAAFSQMEKRWQETYAHGGRPAKSADADGAAKDEAKADKARTPG